ncbi:MAG: hypothetical protein WAU88_03180 [Candidatus Zixiibacteriota bacterium]
MTNEHKTLTDDELIDVILQSPGSADGMAAREVLLYRQYTTLKRHNLWLLIITVVLAIGTFLQAAVGLFK